MLLRDEKLFPDVRTPDLDEGSSSRSSWKNECLCQNHQRLIINAEDKHNVGDPLNHSNIGAPVINIISKSSLRTHPVSHHRESKARHDANLCRKL